MSKTKEIKLNQNVKKGKWILTYREILPSGMESTDSKLFDSHWDAKCEMEDSSEYIIREKFADEDTVAAYEKVDIEKHCRLNYDSCTSFDMDGQPFIWYCISPRN